MINFDQLTGELSLKAIAWDFDRGLFVSPSKKDFIWRDDGLESAECSVEWIRVRSKQGRTMWLRPKLEPVPSGWEVIEQGPCKDEDIPGDDCFCGLYSTFRWRILGKGYTRQSAINPIMLVEAVGKTQLHDDGVRSYQQAIRAVVGSWEPKRVESVTGDFIQLDWGRNVLARTRAAAYQAAHYFNVPVLDAEVATVVMDLWNIHLNALQGHEDDNEFGYMPESLKVRGMSLGEINTLSRQYLPVKPRGVPATEEVTWQTLLRSG